MASVSGLESSDTHSIKNMKGTMIGLAGIPGGTNAFTYPPRPLRLMPTTWVMINVNKASTSVKEMLLVTGKLLGTSPSRFKTSKKMNRLRVYGNHFLPSSPNWPDRKSTRLNSSHANISYAVFCLKKKKKLK